MENLDPPPLPKSRMGKWRGFALRAASSLGMGGLLFHFILSKIVGVTFQSNSKFSEHVKAKLCQAKKCLFVIKGLRN